MGDFNILIETDRYVRKLREVYVVEDLRQIVKEQRCTFKSKSLINLIVTNVFMTRVLQSYPVTVTDHEIVGTEIDVEIVVNQRYDNRKK